MALLRHHRRGRCWHELADLEKIPEKEFHHPVAAAFAEHPPRVVETRLLDQHLFVGEIAVAGNEGHFRSWQLRRKRDGLLGTSRADVDHDVVEFGQYFPEFRPEQADLFLPPFGADRSTVAVATFTFRVLQHERAASVRLVPTVLQVGVATDLVIGHERGGLRECGCGGIHGSHSVSGTNIRVRQIYSQNAMTTDIFKERLLFRPFGLIRRDNASHDSWGE